NYPYEGPDLTSVYYHHIPVHFCFTIDYLVAQAQVRSGGKIRFPYSTQKNYAWFDERTYGLRPGEIFGEKGGVLWIEKGVAKPENVMVDWIAARSADRFYLMLMSQAEKAITIQPNLDAQKIGLAAGEIRLYENDRDVPKIFASLPRKGLTIPAKGMITLSMPATPKEMLPTVPPLQKGHVVTDLESWGKLHTFRIRSPFGKDAIFATLIADPVDGAKATLKANIGGREKTMEVANFPYEFSIYPVGIDQEVSFEFAMSGPATKPERSAQVQAPSGK
ncbi:hypothetical protein HQ520_18380, partial [bacterium]|nr:hypothetical protein [bacterium]